MTSFERFTTKKHGNVRKWYVTGCKHFPETRCLKFISLASLREVITAIFQWWYAIYIYIYIYIYNDDVIKWKHFPRYWPFVRGFTGHRWIPRTKASDAELFLICAFFYLRLNTRLSKQSCGWWFETPSRSSWCHSNYIFMSQGSGNVSSALDIAVLQGLFTDFKYYRFDILYCWFFFIFLVVSLGKAQRR